MHTPPPFSFVTKEKKTFIFINEKKKYGF